MMPKSLSVAAQFFGASKMTRASWVYCIGLIVAGFSSHAVAQAPPSNLKAAVAKVDITPADGTPVVGHVRQVSGVRDPLSAVLLLLDDSRTKAAILTLDLLGTGGDMTPRLREAIGTGTGISDGNIMIAASHNHSGPGWKENEAWSRKVERDVAAAAKKAAA